MQDSPGQAVTLVDFRAVGRDQRVVDRENVQRFAILQHQRSLTGLAVTGAVPGVSQANAVFVVDFVVQRGDHTETVRDGLARVVTGHDVKRVAVTVQVHAVVITATEHARVVNAVEGLEGFIQTFRTATIGFHILVARVDRQNELVGQRDARVDAHIARVGRVVTTVKLGTAIAELEESE